MSTNSGGNLGFEDRLWNAADMLRGMMDAAEYKHVVLGLIFLKYISDAFLEKYAELEADPLADPEERDAYSAVHIFWVPQEARWDELQSRARSTDIGQRVDEAMAAIERDNISLEGVLPKEYARRELDKTRLGELIDLIATIGLGDRESREQDILGRVYEYFLARFAEKEGKGGGEFYTPQCVVKLLVEMLEPFRNRRVFDPCCGSGGMFVQAARFVEAHANGNGSGLAGVSSQVAIYGQEMNPTTWRLAKMNMAIRGIDADIRWNTGGSFLQDAHRDLKADFVLANPPFNQKEWGYTLAKDDVRWEHGLPPRGNANYAWIQHFIHHLAPAGIAGFVMANGSMSTTTSGEGDIRRNIIEADLVDSIIALPGQLFYTTQIPVCLWFITRSKQADPLRGFRARAGETLFIDARQMGQLIDRTHRELTDEEIIEISRTYHAWRGEEKDGPYEDRPGFCKAATLADIRAHDHMLVPGRYIDPEPVEDDGIPFEEKMAELTSRLFEQMDESRKLDAVIRRNLGALGYGD